MFQRLTNSIARRFGYDAVEDKGRRRAPKVTPLAEDRHLKDKARAKMAATSRDIHRNFVIAAWSVRRHLDYVSSFSFQARTGDDETNALVEAYIANWSKRQNCDIARRHPLRRLIRLAEARRVVEGDVGFLKIAPQRPSNDRGKLQGIEGDRVKTPTQDLPRNFDPRQWTNGVKTTPAGAAIAYAICDRTGLNGRLTAARFVSARSMIWHGFYDRFDQVRGISPVAAALNGLQDVYEGVDMALAKLKVSQMFGIAFFRDALDGPNDIGRGQSAKIDEDGDGEADTGYEIDWGRGPVQIDLDPGDRAEFLEAKTPSTETVNLLRLVIEVTIKALDLPYSFFDESHTNFYGSRGALIQYLKSCKTKREDVADLLNEITRWRLGLAIADGDLILPPGMTFDQLNWLWVPDGVPWWDPQKEATGQGMSVGAGFTTPQRVCRENGTDFFENVDAIAEAQAYAKEKGVKLVFPGVKPDQAVDQAEENARNEVPNA